MRTNERRFVRPGLTCAWRTLRRQAGLVAGRARAWTLLVTAWVRADQGETAQLDDTAAEALQLAEAAEDWPAGADAQCLLGDVRQARGDLHDAQAAFGETLSIIRQLAEQDPSNAGWQRDLALAYLRHARLEAKAERHHAALPQRNFVVSGIKAEVILRLYSSVAQGIVNKVRPAEVFGQFPTITPSALPNISGLALRQLARTIRG